MIFSYSAVIKNKIIYVFKNPKDDLTKSLVSMENKISLRKAIKEYKKNNYELWFLGLNKKEETRINKLFFKK